MEKHNLPIEIKNPKFEKLMRAYTDKHREPIVLSDIQRYKETIQEISNGNIIPCLERYNPFYWEYLETLKTFITENRDTNALNLYTTMTAGGMFNRLKYRQIFGLCLILGVTDIYDIGCGDDLQVGYIAQYCGISYTGIDRREDCELEKYNELFESYNPNICFRRRTYPCEIEVTAFEHMAILVGWYIPYSEEMADALARDFSRIYIQVHEEYLDLFKKKFENYSFLEMDYHAISNYFTDKKLGGYTFLFATKFPEDIQYLKEIGYHYHDNRFHVGNFMFSDYLERFRENIRKKENISKYIGRI